jgi:hypothetical protein
MGRAAPRAVDATPAVAIAPLASAALRRRKRRRSRNSSRASSSFGNTSRFGTVRNRVSEAMFVLLWW